MRIVTWNCNLSLGRKLDALLTLNPDAAVIQECEEKIPVPAGYKYVWCGENKRKGLGVLSRDTLACIHPLAKSQWTYFLPVTLPMLKLKLLAVWAFNNRAVSIGPERTGYVRQAIDEMAEWLTEGRSVVAGDFNNCAIWDRPHDSNSMTEIAKHLSFLELSSTYHDAQCEKLGNESAMTHYHQKNIAKGFHIDYCFLHRGMGPAKVELPKFEPWRTLSDHVPLLTIINDA